MDGHESHLCGATGDRLREELSEGEVQFREAERMLAPLNAHIQSCLSGRYMQGGINPCRTFLEDSGWAKHFYLGNIVKYAARYPQTKNKTELLKLAHYALMLYHLNHE